MMPIFFHIDAHLWIFLVLFLNGFCIHSLAYSISKQYREITRTLEAQVIMSFAFSLSLNGISLMLLDFLNLPFSFAKYILLTTVILALSTAFKNGFMSIWKAEVNLAAFVIYILMFIVLFYNGGLIDQISDAWWHMSLANKIGWANSFTLEYGHLTGEPTRYYPPLWHGNLALVKELSGQSIPNIWNAYTAWGGVLKLMAVYLLSASLFGDKLIGFVAALFFALLPGVGSSYMRVSAWPSHQSYIMLFFSLYLMYRLINKLMRPQMKLMSQIKQIVTEPIDIVVLFLSLVLMFFL